MSDAAERVLFVHAHPDDETISTGGVIATLVDRGARVTVLTCTRGELGEVIPDDLKYLLDSTAELARYRERELADAMRILGVTDHRFLGEENARWAAGSPRRYLDSGMQWGPRGAEPLASAAAGSFTAAELGEAASDVAAVIADVAPSAVVSYDERGGYGHPDHVRAHQAAARAAEVMGVPFFVIEPNELAAEITVDASAVIDRKRAALEAYRTQVTVAGDRFALSNGIPAPISQVEGFRRIRPPEAERYTRAAFADFSIVAKVLALVVVVLVGAMGGLLMTVVHQSNLAIGTVTVPVGLVIGLVTLACLLAGLRIVYRSRALAAAAAIGFLGAIVVLSLPTSGGSVLVPANPVGYAWTFGPAIIAFVALAWPHFARRSTAKIVGTPAPKGLSAQ